MKACAHNHYSLCGKGSFCCCFWHLPSWIWHLGKLQKELYMNDPRCTPLKYMVLLGLSSSIAN
uniref:Uncharacterized protein n=1 Tax=Anguilla anguilla TaxID=7936 RepID=A0A0E9TIN8_ANGAN